MQELNVIKAKPKTGREQLSYNGTKTDYNLFDFWRWSVSDILSNATRGRFAEFIVGTAIKIDPLNLRDEWDAFDLTTDDGIKIEVKSAAYIQAWYQKNYSTISFSIKPSKYWDAENNMQAKEAKRHADLYVFCVLKHKDQNTINPLKMEQWEFYVVPTIDLDNYKRSQHSITLKSLNKVAKPISYPGLQDKINIEYQRQKEQSCL
jgi:hypothetical protein